MTTPHLQPPGTPYLSTWYVARPFEERLAHAKLEYGQPVLLWGPRRQGRTWLWSHVADQWLKSVDDGRRIAPILFHTLPPDAFTSLDACLHAFAAALLEALDDPSPEATLEAAWSGRGDPKAKLNALLSRTLRGIRGPLLLVLDRADLLVGCAFYNDVSGLLRSWAERFPRGEPWSRLRLLVTVSTHPARLSTEINQSFFYGLSDPIEVGDLDRNQVADLATLHGVSLSAADLDLLMDLTGGHPHLVRSVLFDLAGQRYPLSALAAGPPPVPSLAADHLRQHRTRLAASPDLAQGFAALAANPAASVPSAVLDALIRQGLVRQGDKGTHPVRYRLYQRLLTADAEPAPANRVRRRLFYSYSPADEKLRERLEVHLKLLERDGLIEPWHARQILPGAEWAREIDRHLEAADLILLLVSADFVASDYTWDGELKRALERHHAGKATVVPVMVRPCDCKTAPFAKLDPLPRDGVPVTRWPDPEDAWVDVAQGLRRLIT
jgi:AAA-like domain/TIR domain